MASHRYDQQRIRTNGIELDAILAGPADGPLCILLHGFPEFWYGWRAQIQPLADAGYRVLVPDQRGYNRSDKPRGIGAYRVSELARDVVGLIDAQGRERALLVGHDWGAMVCWWTALQHAERVDRMAVLNVPHPWVMAKTVATSLRQLQKSWYIGFFQIPELPERWLMQDDCAGLARSLRGSSRQGTFSDDDLQRYREAWTQPGAITSMIHWYRAAVRRPPRLSPDLRVQVPTLILWGAQDRFLSRDMVLPSLDLCDHGELRWFESATHWLQHEQPGEVSARLVEFFAGPDPRRAA
ncbi:MAG: alpha/beta hydrolase [Deltaproteobacteria bacterium]|jgi:pimeloyl-ACP methyl ester carboxylesterase|nr:alpha/beta hydrolase [Deltaproteobacteria bacterium]MBW2534772.1 alpha/beta hydrolase [Deltaproteobacteria bacterium]